MISQNPSAILDSCVIIDYLRNDAKAVALFTTLRNSRVSPSISVITEIELKLFVQDVTQKPKLLDMLRQFDRYPVLLDMADRTVELLRKFQNDPKQKAVLFNDAIIASTAEHYGMDIFTTNTKHFRLFPLSRSHLRTLDESETS